jgi:predicted ATPase/DNA-binding SARP family transcriptional activator
VNAARPGLQVRLLGQPQLHDGSGPVDFRAPTRAISLLMYLLLHQDQALARDAVASMFWPDLPESEGRARLRYDIRDLRAALPATDGAPWIEADNRTIRWNPEAAVWLDIAEFERLAADPLTAARAVELYGGDLAARFDDEWLESPRERLRQLQSSLLWGLVESSRARNEPRRAVRYAQQLAQHDPWREDAVRALIELRHLLGDRAGALQTYRDFVQRLKAELDVEPMRETTIAYEHVLNAVEPPAAALIVSPKHNLPESMTSFVGRESDVETLRTALGQRRLLTLVGAGGVGKSRLAIEVARSIAERFADGVWLVELAPVVDAGLIASTIGTVLGFQSSTDASLPGALRQKQLLLLLDNCEHLIEAAAATVDRLVKACPKLRVLVTSREPLRVEGERTERVVNLDEVPAAKLFLDRAADVAPAFRLRTLDDADRQALAVISRRLDGIPLAIEFAAAWVSSLSLGVLAQRLDDRFALLTSGKRTALPRHQTLRATFDWSYALLPALEQSVLQRLSVFVGGWTLEAAGAVCGDESLSETEVVAALGSLVDKSLIVMEDGPLGQPRYRLLETTRAYALERLTQAGEHARMSRCHAEFFAGFAERYDGTWQAHLSPNYAALNAALRLDLDNWRAALKWAIDEGNDPGLGAFLVCALRWFFSTLALYSEGDRWCERALTALGTDPETRHEALIQLSIATMRGTFPFYQRFHYRAGTAERSLSAARRAAELFRTTGDNTRLSMALSMVAMYCRLTNQLAGADAAANEAASLARSSEQRVLLPIALYTKSFLIDPKSIDQREALLTEARDAASTLTAPYARGSILMALSELTFEAGDPASALIRARECQRAFEGYVSWANLAQLEISISAYSLATGQIAEADAAARRALAIGRQIGEPMVAATACQLFAGVAASHGDFPRAGRLLGASDARLATGQPRLFTEQWVYDWTLAQLKTSLLESELDPLISEGRAWNVEEAIAYILRGRE